MYKSNLTAIMIFSQVIIIHGICRAAFLGTQRTKGIGMEVCTVTLFVAHQHTQKKPVSHLPHAA